LGSTPGEVTIYSDDDFETLGIGRRERRACVPPGLDNDGVAGSGYVEIKLSKLLA
jgi:hypothetical protein